MQNMFKQKTYNQHNKLNKFWIKNDKDAYKKNDKDSQKNSNNVW